MPFLRTERESLTDDHIQALFEDWKAKREAIEPLVRKYFGHRWTAWSDNPWTEANPPRPLSKNAIRELEEVREAEAAAFQALVECVQRGS